MTSELSVNRCGKMKPENPSVKSTFVLCLVFFAAAALHSWKRSSWNLMETWWWWWSKSCRSASVKPRVKASTHRSSFTEVEHQILCLCHSVLQRNPLFLAVHLYNKALYIIYTTSFEAGVPHVDRRHYRLLSQRLPVTPTVLSARKMSESRPWAQTNCCIQTQVH